MKTKNLDTFHRAAVAVLGISFLFAAMVFYHHPLAVGASAFLGMWLLITAATGSCSVHRALGIRSPKEKLPEKKLYLLGLYGVQLVLAYEWWHAGYDKIAGGEFVSGITGTLGFFASENPFSWYAAFLEGPAMANATAFAYAVEWGQVLIGLCLAAAVLVHLYMKDEGLRRLALAGSVLALLGGALMNANFYLAAGWTGPGTKGSNLVMFWIQIALAYVWVSALRKRR